MLGLSAWQVALLGVYLTTSALFPGAARASDAVRGVVLGVTPAGARVVLRQDASSDMPSMAMTYAVAPPSLAKKLHVGATIEGDADASTEPSTLRNVRILSDATVRVAERPYRTLVGVKPVAIGDPVPDAAFIDERGAPFSLASLRGHPVVLAFIYTRCGDARMCPLISSKFSTLQTLLKPENARLVEVTLDPVYDRPPVLTAYGKLFGADPAVWRFATGDESTVLGFAARFGVSSIPDDRYGLIHSERTVVVDRDGIVRTMIDEAEWTPEQVVTAVQTADDRAANPLARFDLWLSSAAVAVCGSSVSGLVGYSGLLDLIVALAIFGAFAWLLLRIARGLRTGS